MNCSIKCNFFFTIISNFDNLIRYYLTYYIKEKYEYKIIISRKFTKNMFIKKKSFDAKGITKQTSLFCSASRHIITSFNCYGRERNQNIKQTTRHIQMCQDTSDENIETS